MLISLPVSLTKVRVTIFWFGLISMVVGDIVTAKTWEERSKKVDKKYKNILEAKFFILIKLWLNYCDSVTKESASLKLVC